MEFFLNNIFPLAVYKLVKFSRLVRYLKYKYSDTLTRLNIYPKFKYKFKDKNEYSDVKIIEIFGLIFTFACALILVVFVILFFLVFLFVCPSSLAGCVAAA